ncbi:MAG TPA: hypothetical protein VFU14_16445 [Acidimicrobiales bacterium]|nr:hypothetical protein [Acidimicrobiales bacterium]
MPSTSHPAALVAAAASTAAGLIHAAAAGSHAELTTLSRLFGAAAVLQIAWAAAVLLRRTRPVVLAGVAVNLGALAAWGVTRSAGISAIEGLEVAQDAGFPDTLAAGAAALAAFAGVLSLSVRSVPRLGRVAAPALVGVLALATVPAMATPHDHGIHAHDEAGLAAAHEHDDSHVHDDSHADGDHDSHHDDDPAAVPTEADLGYPVSFASWLDRADTATQRERAEQLIIDTTKAMAAFPDEAAIQAAGFVSIGDGGTGWEHYVHVQRIIDPRVLDPADIESIVLKVDPDGTKEVASAMYLLPFGSTMADVPDVAGDLTTWHDHQNLCWDGVRVVGTTDATGSCARGAFRPTQPMLHVWMIDHPCGPFAGIEGSHGSGCGHAHDEAPDAEAGVAAGDDHPHEPGTPEHGH